MNNLLRDRRIDPHKLWSEQIASRQTRNRNELTILAVISFYRDGQMDAMKHLAGDLEHQAVAKILRNADAGLNCVRVIVISRALCDPPVRLTRPRDDPKGANIGFAQSHQWKFADAHTVSPQRLC